MKINNKEWIITIEEEENKEVYDAIGNGLKSFNIMHLGNYNYEPFSLYIMDSSSNIIAGITGGIRGYLSSKVAWVDFMWVEESHRRKGLGTQLLNGLHDYTVRQQCDVIQLSLYSFQAKQFYEKQGYKLISTFPQYFAGYDKLFMRKPLNDSSLSLDASHVIIDKTGQEEIKEIIKKGVSCFTEPYVGDDIGKPFILYLLTNTSKLIGGIRGNLTHSVTWCNIFWVDEDYRGKGVGSWLWRKLEEYTLSKGINEIALETLDFQAKPFYQKMGCRHSGTIPQWVSGRDVYYMKKYLLENMG